MISSFEIYQRFLLKNTRRFGGRMSKIDGIHLFLKNKMQEGIFHLQRIPMFVDGWYYSYTFPICLTTIPIIICYGQEKTVFGFQKAPILSVPMGLYMASDSPDLTPRPERPSSRLYNYAWLTMARLHIV